jgi:ribonuclease D
VDQRSQAEAATAADEPAGPDAPPASTAVPLLEPRDGLPDVVVDARGLSSAIDALAAGDGPVAVDAERASGYRYGQRVYLVQMRRRGSRTWLIDPVPFDFDLSALQPVLAELEWVIHAASQDLPCLSDAGLRPASVFDTELAGRLLGYPRVGLAAMVEGVLGFSMEKGHAAVDWSQRPMPDDWLRYAALDVEVLLELRDALHAELATTGKLPWALEEFANVAAAPPPTPRTDPWRRTSGIHRVRSPRQLAAVRELWLARDQLAQQRDTAPGRLLPDAAIVDAARSGPTTVAELTALPVFGGRANRRIADTWLSALDRARALPVEDLPPATLPHDGPPPAKSWPDRDPEAARRLAALRPAVAAIADEHHLPTENLLSPDTVRRIAWQPPAPATQEAIAAVLAEHGARPWQIALTAVPLTRALDRLARSSEVR